MIICEAAASAQRKFIRHLITSPLARMSDDGHKKQFDNAELKQRLSVVEYAVTQLKHTEP